MSTSQKENKEENNAVVCLSGGQDSTTCLLWAKRKFDNVSAIVFDYNQLHIRELRAAEKVSKMLDVPLTVLKIPILSALRSGLTDPNLSVHEPHPDFPELPGSFVPLRNLILLSSAAAYAIKNGITNLVTGVCQTDYSGYPDCREGFIRSLKETINHSLGINLNEKGFTIHTPLMYLTKADTVRLAKDCNGYGLMAYTHTCYEGKFPPCGKCAACVLRAKGFKEAKVLDPLILRAEEEKV